MIDFRVNECVYIKTDDDVRELEDKMEKLKSEMDRVGVLRGRGVYILEFINY